MAKINLLPWREELRKQKQRDFGNALFLSVIVTGFFLFLMHMHIDGLIEHQSKRNKKMKDEIANVDKLIQEINEIEEKKSLLLKKIDIIQKLQQSRPQIVHLFDELPKATPDGVILSKLTQNGESLKLEGKAESNARVSAFMRAIENSSWLTDPKLEQIVTTTKAGGKDAGAKDYAFSMQAKQSTPKSDTPQGEKK